MSCQFQKHHLVNSVMFALNLLDLYAENRISVGENIRETELVLTHVHLALTQDVNIHLKNPKLNLECF